MPAVPSPDHLSVETLSIGATCLISIRGELDAHSAPKLAAAVDGAIRALATKVVLDAADLTFIDSSGIDVLIRAWNRLKDRATMPIVVTNLQPHVQRTLDICGVSDLVVE